MNLRPLNDAIVIFPQPVQETGSVIVAPQTAVANQIPVWGTIVALGPKATKELKVGQTVLFEMHSGTEKRIWIPDGKTNEEHEVRIITEDNVIAFLEE